MKQLKDELLAVVDRQKKEHESAAARKSRVSKHYSQKSKFRNEKQLLLQM